MNILSAVWKQFKTLVVFLLLEMIALWLILSINPYQNSSLFQSTTSVRSNLLSTFSLWENYFNLGAENRRLVSENTRLAEKLKNSAAVATTPTQEISGQYHYIPAKVMYSSIGLPDNYFIVNQGTKNGVHPEMAVISSTGLVGVVHTVTTDYALVMPMINTSFSCLVSISAYTLSANTSWSGTDYRYITVKGVPLHLSIQKGDSVFTNNNSTLYPSHELIGVVEGIEKEDLGKSFALKVKLATDFATLQNVYIIENKDKPQIDSLLENE